MALTPNYLQKCTDGIERQYQQLVTEILVDLADRISHAKGMTSTAEYLNEKLREMSLHQVCINQMLAKVLNTTEKEVEELMEESTYKSTRSEIKNLEAHGYDTSGLEFAAQIEKSTNVAKNELTNLTRTTGQLATAKLMNIYDQAYLQVSTGAYSYDQAVTNAVKKLAKDGLGEVTYPTGAKRTVEAAVRVAVRTSVSQNALKCEEDMLDDMDVNLVEVSSHLGARPSHAVWQGKIYWRKHPEGNYENFYEATGYGTPTGLGGYNCRHQHYAYFGDDDEQAYHHIDETLNKEAYDMEQKQRSLERKLREWDRKEKILNAGGVDSTEAKRWKSYYKKKLDEHVKSSHGFLKRDYAAEKAWSGISLELEHVTEQEKKKSRQSTTRVNWEYVKSAEYHGKFKNLTANEKVNETIYLKAMDMLNHQSGTLMEDLHLININTGRVVASQTHSATVNSVTPTKEIIRVSKKFNGDIVAIHNHPESGYPSGGDYASFQKRNYKKAYVICHDGSIYEYWSGKTPISSTLIDMTIEKKRRYIYNEDEAYREAMKELSRDYGIGWRKV